MRPTCARGLLALIGAVSGVQPGTAQQATDYRPLDRIVAIVGSKAILASQLEEQVVQLRAQGLEVPADSAALQRLRRDVLRDMVEEELLVQQAERDTTVVVSEQEVLDAVEQTVQNVRSQFTSELELQRQLRQIGFASVDEWRRRLADLQRRRILRDRLIQSLQQAGELKPIPPSDSAVQAFWEENRGQLPRRPALVSFRQIVVSPRPDSAAKAAARAHAESLLVALRGGADFAETARRFSDDTVSAPQGGDLGWFRRGTMVREFEARAFALRPGAISDVFETDFGYHILQVRRSQPAEVLARHVLIAPEIGPSQIADARRIADSVHAALAAGASFDSLARRYADPNEPKLAEEVALAQLPPEYTRALEARDGTGLLPVFVVGEGSRRPSYVVLIVTDRKGEGELTFEDVKDRIRERLSQDNAVEHLIRQLQRETYVDVRL